MRLLALIMAVMLALAGRASAAEDKLIVFAASSLTEALGDVGRAYAQSGRVAPTFSFAASSALARQIENGAPAALFMSADEDWMDYLDKHHLIVDGTRAPLLGNTLVLIAPADRPLAITIAPHFDLASALGDGKLAMADPESVPAGLYGKAALQKLGVWDAVSPKVIRGENVRTALSFVERGEIFHACGAKLTVDASAASVPMAVASCVIANGFQRTLSSVAIALSRMRSTSEVVRRRVLDVLRAAARLSDEISLVRLLAPALSVLLASLPTSLASKDRSEAMLLVARSARLIPVRFASLAAALTTFAVRRAAVPIFFFASSATSDAALRPAAAAVRPALRRVDADLFTRRLVRRDVVMIVLRSGATRSVNGHLQQKVPFRGRMLALDFT